jgi:predicted CXXCH cytochrome family protein
MPRAALGSVYHLPAVSVSRSINKIQVSISSHPLLRIAALTIVAVTAGCDSVDDAPNSDPARDIAGAEFVGAAVCESCHAEAAALWRGSDHDQALELATAETVLGNFDNVEVTDGGRRTRFFSNQDGYWVTTDGPDGSVGNFKVTHTIGIDPLQQYLLEMPKGHYQALSIAWDTRPSENGGQRWFPLYPNEPIGSDNPLHWTGTYQRWNTMCAECHSTDLRKNYDPDRDRFDTTYAGIDVNCEACHGPGSIHAADPSVAPLALVPAERTWTFNDGASIAALADGSERSTEIDVCAQCHARRSQLTDDYAPPDPLLNGFRPTLLETGLYHADGQILDEVYVYGSFLQSAMAAAGVICSDCHEPHSTALRANGNAVCGRCHLASTFDTPEHHRHVQSSSGSQCVSCHMRAETYMVVDPRRDHSFRVPRPDLSGALGTPNACQDCHSDQTASWAENRIAEWYPDGRQNEFHYGEALHAGRTWAEDRAPLLRQVIEDRNEPAIVRATALSLLAEQIDAPDVDLIGRLVDDTEPLVQLAALEAMSNLPPQLRFPRAQRLLTDPLLALRISAARVLLAAREQLSPRRQGDLDAALLEYNAVQQFNSDRGSGLVNAAALAAEQGRPQDAERLLIAATEREPAFSATYINLADLYRSVGREPEAEDALRRGLAINPDDAGLNLALGLSLVRSGQRDAALPYIDQAVRIAPDSPYYAYVQGIALNSAGQPARAIDALTTAHERFPGHRDTLFGLVTVLRDAGQTDAALEYAEKLVSMSPSSQPARRLLEELEEISTP